MYCRWMNSLETAKVICFSEFPPWELFLFIYKKHLTHSQRLASKFAAVLQHHISNEAALHTAARLTGEIFMSSMKPSKAVEGVQVWGPRPL